jgi:hypothetical protein
MKTHLNKSALKPNSRFAYKLNGEVLCMGLASNRCITSDVFNKHIVVFNAAFERSIQVRPFMSVIIRRIDYDRERKSVTRFAFERLAIHAAIDFVTVENNDAGKCCFAEPLISKSV